MAVHILNPDSIPLMRQLARMASMDEAGIKRMVLVLDVSEPPMLYVESFIRGKSVEELLPTALVVEEKAVDVCTTVQGIEIKESKVLGKTVSRPDTTDDFQIGDLVTIKHKVCKMVIRHIVGNCALCEWFDIEQGMREATFRLEDLQAALLE